MSLSGCYAVMKYLVFLMNLVFWVTGLITIVLSIWMLVDPTFYISMAQDESSYYSGICLLFLAGTLLFIVGFLGCFGAYNESQRLLVLFFCGLLLILVAQISAGMWAYSNSDKLNDLLRYTVRNTVHNEYGKPESQRTDAFDSIQSGLKCCGADGPSDWYSSSWRGEENQLKLTMRSPLKTYEIPKSCCDLEHYTVIQCNDAVKVNGTALISPVIYPEGCFEKLRENLKEHMSTVIIITIAIGIVEFFALVISLILCCAIRAVTKYK